jgi:glutathione S-transferase
MEKIRWHPARAARTPQGMKLYRFRHSSYARKVQVLLDLLGHQYEWVEVPYLDRSELALLTGGYIYVPVLVLDDGRVLVESRDICQHLLAGEGGKALVPSPFEGPIWAYHDFVDNTLEDVLFRLASPPVRDAWESPGARALYVLTKERKFGAGCVDAWERDRAVLIARAQKLLAPTLSTLEQQPFVFGKTPTLADCSLYGNCAMLHEADPALLPSISPALVAFMQRLERARPVK